MAEVGAAKAESAKAKLHALKAGSRPEEKNRVQALLASAEAELARQNITSKFQIQSARAQVDKAKAQVDLKAELQKTRIVASINGTRRCERTCIRVKLLTCCNHDRLLGWPI